jgi:hypothetical protein
VRCCGDRACAGRQGRCRAALKYSATEGQRQMEPHLESDVCLFSMSTVY